MNILAVVHLKTRLEGRRKGLGKQVPAFLGRKAAAVAMRRQRESCVVFLSQGADRCQQLR